jgi:pyruvate ferredoxin oxidoreductase alpha subunit
MGSVCGTIKAVIQNNPDVALIKIRSFRPFPALSLNKVINSQIKNIAVIEKVAPTANFSPLFTEIKSNLNNFSGKMTNHIVGLGGTDISEALINKIIKYQAKTSLKFW